MLNSNSEKIQNYINYCKERDRLNCVDFFLAKKKKIRHFKSVVKKVLPSVRALNGVTYINPNIEKLMAQNAKNVRRISWYLNNISSRSM